LVGAAQEVIVAINAVVATLARAVLTIFIGDLPPFLTGIPQITGLLSTIYRAIETPATKFDCI
jgi:hypothetical protein